MENCAELEDILCLVASRAGVKAGDDGAIPSTGGVGCRLSGKLISPNEHVCLFFWRTRNRLFKLRQKTTCTFWCCHCSLFSLKREAQRMFVLPSVKCPAVTTARGHTALHWGDCTQESKQRTTAKASPCPDPKHSPAMVTSELRL